MKPLLMIVLMCWCAVTQAQQGFAFTRISTADGTGLASNMVSSLYQDDKGFIWVGTANGLQRFDGSKFIRYESEKQGRNNLPNANISQIVPSDSGRLILLMPNIGELGVFNPSDFSYQKIKVITAAAIPPRAEYRLWKSANGQIHLVVSKYGILTYDAKQNVFADTKPFPFPPNWHPYITGVYEDLEKKQVWFACDSGVCIYDKRSRQTWWRGYNPGKIAILDNELLRENVTQVYIDHKKRIWIFGWPAWNVYRQYKFCFDRDGKMLHSDTAGLNRNTSGFTAYDYFYETTNKMLWIYGAGVLYNYDEISKKFILNKSVNVGDEIGINYNIVNEVMQDKDGGLWIATDKGLYYTSAASDNMSVVNLILNYPTENISITDMLETTSGEYWFGTKGNGIKSLDSFFNKTPNAVYNQPPPASWTPAQKADSKFIWSMCQERNSPNIWLGCNYGVLMIHNMETKQTRYLLPPECNYTNIHYITQDRQGAVWLGTRGGRLIKYVHDKFTVVLDLSTVINKVFIDSEGLFWISTSGKGLYVVDEAGRVLHHFTNNSTANSLYSNTGMDIEQLDDSTIVFGAGALNFINKKTWNVSIVQFEDGLPSNNVERLRMDNLGFLWIITPSGLCRYNPHNHRITPYGPKDGIVIAEQTNMADYLGRNGQVIFTGSNSVIMLQPSMFSKSHRPPNVTITDFKIFNQYIPVDSLLQYPEIKMLSDQNSFSIYFSSLSYIQRDKLTYYYKMEGIDKDWIKADRSYFVNYSLMPPGRYNFKIYCENLEGIASEKVTELNIFIKPPFWNTWWFMSCILFAIALMIYVVHDLRVNRILAVENLRQRVARDLHDDMGSTLSTINILSSMAKARMNTDAVRTSEYLGKISDNSQRMMEAMDDIIWSIKPSNDSMQRIAARMREFATSVLEAKDIDLEFNIKEDIYDVKLNMEARRDFFLVFKEAINNAAKYSNAERVWVNVSMENRKLILEVKDNGKGFKPDDENDGNGLGNMRKRTDHMNGKLSIKSKINQGTVVTVVVPMNH